MDITTNDLIFGEGFFACLVVIFIFWLIHKYCKWVDKVNGKLNSIEVKLNDQEYNIDNLKARVKKLEDNVSILEKVDVYSRINNTSYNEEGLGSINPSEADTE